MSTVILYTIYSQINQRVYCHSTQNMGNFYPDSWNWWISQKKFRSFIMRSSHIDNRIGHGDEEIGWWLPLWHGRSAGAHRRSSGGRWFFPRFGENQALFFRPKKFVWLADFFSFPVDYFPNLYYTGYQMERMASQPEYEEEYSNELQPHV